ncbi:MAG: hypothetical protein GXN99_01975 [Candidatus Nanohaloarchaeota archaeon]|nr:hypothetical protein [Candidatus Nanohaloarchaeota archaeon]
MVAKKTEDSKHAHYLMGIALLSIIALAFLIAYFYQASRYYSLQQDVQEFITILNITPLESAQQNVKVAMSRLLNTSENNINVVSAEYVEGLYAFNISYNNTYYVVYSTIDTSYLLLPYQDALNGLMLKVYVLK